MLFRYSSERFRTVPNHKKPWNYLELFGTIRNYLELFGFNPFLGVNTVQNGSERFRTIHQEQRQYSSERFRTVPNYSSKAASKYSSERFRTVPDYICNNAPLCRICGIWLTLFDLQPASIGNCMLICAEQLL